MFQVLKEFCKAWLHQRVCQRISTHSPTRISWVEYAPNSLTSSGTDFTTFQASQECLPLPSRGRDCCCVTTTSITTGKFGNRPRHPWRECQKAIRALLTVTTDWPLIAFQVNVSVYLQENIPLMTDCRKLLVSRSPVLSIHLCWGQPPVLLWKFTLYLSVSTSPPVHFALRTSLHHPPYS